MKKVLICANTTWYLYNFRKSLIEKMIQSGYQVYIVSGHDNYINKLTDLGCIHLPLRIISKSLNPLNEVLTFYDYFSKVRAVRPDIIFNFTIKPSIYGTLIATFFSIKAVNTITGLGTAFLTPGLLQFITIKLYRFSLRFSDHVFFQNKDDREFFLKADLIKSEQSSIVAGSGIDLVRFRVTPTEKNEVFTFLYIGRLIGDKGVRELVEAMKSLHQSNFKVKLQLLGPKYPDNRSAINDSELEGWIRDGIVQYLGSTDRVEEYIKESDCIVLPSYREGLPRVLLEAAAMAKPVIATDVPGCREVVLDKVTGLLCTVRDPKDLENKMKALINMEQASLEEMGRKGREFVEKNFDQEMVIKEYLLKCGDPGL